MSGVISSTKRGIADSLSFLWPRHVAPRIIYYHSIHPTFSGSIRPNVFAEQLDWLLEQGFQFLTFSQIAEKSAQGDLPKRSISITFDDGYLDNYEYALPILLGKGVLATFFVVSQMIGDSPQLSQRGQKLYPNRHMMTKSNLREMYQLGMEIGSHTRQHTHVREILEQSEDTAFEELYGSRQDIENILGAPVTTFAYPNGQKGVFNSATDGLLQKAGYHFAATTIWGYLNQACNAMEVPRIGMNNPTETLRAFAARVMGHYDFLRYYHLAFDLSHKW